MKRLLVTTYSSRDSSSYKNVPVQNDIFKLYRHRRMMYQLSMILWERRKVLYVENSPENGSKRSDITIVSQYMLIYGE